MRQTTGKNNYIVDHCRVFGIRAGFGIHSMKFQLYDKQNQKPKIGDIVFAIYADGGGQHAANGRITKVNRAWFNLAVKIGAEKVVIAGMAKWKLLTIAGTGWNLTGKQANQQTANQNFLDGQVRNNND